MSTTHEKTWAVITEEGLTMWVNLTEATAREIAANPTRSGSPQHAVPMGVAQHATAMWRRIEERNTDVRREQRLAMVRRILTGEFAPDTGAVMPNGSTVVDYRVVDGRTYVLAINYKGEFVTWAIDAEGNASWGHYFTGLAAAVDDLRGRGH